MLLFSLAPSLSVRQLKPEILVCRMAAVMINVAKERWKLKKKRKRDRKELLSLCMLMKAIYILYFLSQNRSIREEKGGWGDYNVVGPPL